MMYLRDWTVKEATINTVIGLEVLCWFFIGECIGKGSIIGYQVQYMIIYQRCRAGSRGAAGAVIVVSCVNAPFMVFQVHFKKIDLAKNMFSFS